jgi:penicillin-binding protein 1A
MSKAAPARSARRRVAIVNPSDGGLLFWLARLYAFAALGLLSALLWAGAGAYVRFAAQLEKDLAQKGLPPLPDLARYADQAPGVTTLYGLDGSIIAELSRERREVVPLDRVPPKLIDAFVATEDRRFFEHGGIDLRGLVRAFVVNLRAGGVAQGGSTITQQVAKSYLSSERSYSRKLKEAILARRIEARYSKRAILALYLNQIFLGNGAYGVQAAARRYFDKDLSELDLGEMAMIAGLARAPSRDSPLVDLDAAMARREQVLLNMAAIGSISDEEARRWAKTQLVVRPRRDYFHEVAPYFAEHVRRDLVKRYGQQGVYESGLRVETTVVPELDVLAADNVDVAARKLDKRQGYRGPEAHLGPDLAKIFRSRAATLYGSDRLVEDKLYLGLVEEVTQAEARVRVGGKVYPLPVDKMRWAARYSSSDATNDKQIEGCNEALRKGDVIWVRWAWKSRIPRFSEFTYNEEGEAVWVAEQPLKRPPPGPQVLMLEQAPRVSGSLFTFDHHDGYVYAMAGGDDFDQSEFNRVVQSCRQPGSAYKPIYYSLAIDRGYPFDSEWNDKPKAEIDPVTGELWVPQNVDGTYSVRVSLEKALVWSKNPPSVEIFETLGAKDVEKWARKFGFTTPIHADKALALGASCIKTDELSRAFAIFARNGRPLDNVYVRRVLDRRGRVVEDHTAWDDTQLAPADRLDRVAALFGDEPEPVIAPRTAWLTSTLLRRIVTQGHSGPIRAIKIPAAGKTGTSSHTSDVWFVGFTSRWLTTAWLGDDTYERQLGYKDASFMLSVPMWARYMYLATDGQTLDEIPWERPPGVKPSDIGGPLKPGFPPPPPPGYDASGHPYQLPAKLQGAVLTGPTVPENLVRQKIVRVPGGAPVPPKPVSVPPSP